MNPTISQAKQHRPGFKYRATTSTIKSDASLVAIAKGKLVDNEIPITDLPAKNVAYLNLRLTSLDIQKIGLLLYVLATYNVYRLFKKRSSIEDLGVKTSHIHPLRFLEVIVKNDRLRAYCNSVIATVFLGSMVKRSMRNFLSKRLAQNDLVQYIHDFCDELGLDDKKMGKYVTKKRWYPLIDYILVSSCPKNKKGC